MFELTNGFYKSFLSKGIKIWFELAKVRITGVRINGHWLYKHCKNVKISLLSILWFLNILKILNILNILYCWFVGLLNLIFKLLWTRHYSEIYIMPTRWKKLKTTERDYTKLSLGYNRKIRAFFEYTVKPLYSGHDRDQKKCPLYRGVRYKEVFHFSADFRQGRPVEAQISLFSLIRVAGTYQKTQTVSS